MTKELQKYIQNVNKIIVEYKQYTEIINHDVITPKMINEGLANYGAILFTLSAEYSRKKAEVFTIEEDFKMWWNEKFVAVRRKFNDNGLAASKWLSKSELEAETKVLHKIEYMDKHAQVFAIKEELKLYSNLIDIWKKWDSILMTLAYNMRSELKALSAENRINAPADLRAKVRNPVIDR